MEERKMSPKEADELLYSIYLWTVASAKKAESYDESKQKIKEIAQRRKIVIQTMRKYVEGKWEAG